MYVSQKMKQREGKMRRKNEREKKKGGKGEENGVNIAKDTHLPSN